MTRYFFGASHEEFAPEVLLRHAVKAEQVGFDGISASDHLQPWWEPGESGHAWAWMTWERMFPGRPFLGIGSGEALNEVPVGDDWPSTGDQIARLDEALDIIDRLWNGETITQEGRFFRLRDCKLHSLADRRPPIWVSAFGPQAAPA